ncbi:MAG: DUF4147 domain-containing protein [Gemmatimonadetes bacterium]|nr:DUF4147 domain-containing protein [Gemmatimonadota bacterium]
MSWPTRLREDARAIFDVAVAEVDPGPLVQAALERAEHDLSECTRVELISVGKACAGMAQGADEALLDSATAGLAFGPRGTALASPYWYTVYEGGHPVPDEAGLEGASAVYHVARSLDANDCLVLLISGGTSALLTLPPDGIELEDVRVVTERLLEAGASIEELNTVRKHIDRLKGGRLARVAAPARVIALVLSDVVGDPLDVIGSGPVSPDPTTFADAIAVLERHGGIGTYPERVRAHLEAGRAGRAPESPEPGDPIFERVVTTLIGGNGLAAEAARVAAEARGYRTELLTTTKVGESREVGEELAELGRRMQSGALESATPACAIMAGETTVTVTGSGKGGRNQEVALGAAPGLAGTEGVLVASIGTDGIDGPTDAAGALADGQTVARASTHDLDPAISLADNDAYRFFSALDDLIVTGPTGTNVMDLMLVLVTTEEALRAMEEAEAAADVEDGTASEP